MCKNNIGNKEILKSVLYEATQQPCLSSKAAI